MLRYVAIGDSLSEGVGDEPWPDGSPRGWTDRLAALLADDDPQRPVHYANLAIRGQRAAQVRETQLSAARRLEPDVVTLTAGMNDLLRPRIDFGRLRSDLFAMVSPFTEAGVAVMLVPIPDIVRVSPAGRLIDARRRRLNGLYQELVDECGVLPLTETKGSVFEDPRAWSSDRLHLCAMGHERLALAAASSFGCRVDPGFLDAPEGLPPRRTIRGEVTWLRNDVLPWVGRRLRGTSSGDGRSAKAPDLSPVRP